MDWDYFNQKLQYANCWPKVEIKQNFLVTLGVYLSPYNRPIKCVPDSSGELPDEEGVHLVVDDLAGRLEVHGADGLVVTVDLVAVVVLGLQGARFNWISTDFSIRFFRTGSTFNCSVEPYVEFSVKIYLTVGHPVVNLNGMYSKAIPLVLISIMIQSSV